MQWIELGSPFPRDVLLAADRGKYPRVATVYLTVPVGPLDCPFDRVLEARRSRRKSTRIDRETLGKLLWYSCKTRERTKSGLDVWEHRPAPSGGGRHPIDVLVIEPEAPTLVHLYEPMSHALLQLDSGQADVLALHQIANTVLPDAQGTVIWFAAHFEITLAKYENGESLVWRDAGALISVLNLVAEAMGLSFCALGPTGEPTVSRLLSGHANWRGVGGCVVGARND